jgi:hypothetical protein
MLYRILCYWSAETPECRKGQVIYGRAGAGAEYGLGPTNVCPPDFLVRAVIMESDEPILAHIAECKHCTNIYMGALRSDWHAKHRRSTAFTETASRSANWFAKLGALIQGTRHVPTGLLQHR